jgi:putative transposase
MKKARFSEEQMVAILREADRSPIVDVAKKHKISEQTIYIWRRRFGKLDPADVKRLRELETENAKLKGMVAEREMSIETLKEINRRKW